MEKPSTIHSTFTLERSFPKPPEVVFDAFADPVKKRRWFFESNNSELQAHALDFKVGGAETARMKFSVGPIAGNVITNDSVYENIVPSRRIVTAYRMSLDGVPFSVSVATIEMLATETGTDLLFTHQGAYFEGADGPEMRKGGWEHLFDKLATELAR